MLILCQHKSINSSYSITAQHKTICELELITIAEHNSLNNF